MAKYRFAVREKWLGQNPTGQGVIPPTAGVRLGTRGTDYLERARLEQRSAGAAAVALVALLQDAQWVAGQVTAAGAYTDDTLDAQSATTNDVPLETLTSGDGFLVGAAVPFGAISVDVTTAGAATASVHLLEYWNGSAWAAIAAAGTLVDVPRAVAWALGEQLVCFEPPWDWVKGGSGTNVPQDKYCVRLRSTPTTPTVAALARRLYVGQVLASADGLAANGVLEQEYRRGVALPAGRFAAVGAAFGTIDEGNAFEVELRGVAVGTPEAPYGG